MIAVGTSPAPAGSVATRTAELFNQSQLAIHVRTDRMFARLLLVQWLACIAAAAWISPRTWIGTTSQAHWHVWAAIILGGLLTALPVTLAWRHPGRPITRHVMAVAQMLTSALLIHLTGGRIETHFHIFGSLAFFAFYRDWRVLLTATLVVAADHLFRSAFWPRSAFGVLSAGPWRWVEHAGWVAFEDTFLLLSIRHALNDMMEVASRRAHLEHLNASIEQRVVERTQQLTAAHHELQASESRFRTLCASAPIGIILADVEGHALYLNEHWLHLAGLTREEALHDGWQTSFHPEDSAAILEQWKSLAGQESGLDREFRIRTPGGEVRWVHWRVVALRSDDGLITGYVGSAEHITQRKHDQQALRESEQRYRHLIQALPAAVYTCDAEGHITLYNQAAAALWGRQPVLHHDLWCGSWKIFAPDGIAIPLDECPMAVALREGRSVRGQEIVIERQDGTRCYVLPNPDPIFDAGGRVVGGVNMLVDLTSRKEAEEQLQALHQQLVAASRQAGMAEVATGVLHNVGNVLNSVNVSASLLGDRLKGIKIGGFAQVAALLRAQASDLPGFFARDSRAQTFPAYLEQFSDHLRSENQVMLNELENLRANIEHIRDIVAMQQSHAIGVGIIERVRPAHLFEDALRMTRGSLDCQTIEVIREFDDIPVMEIDKHKVLQILVNFIRNARHACDESGRPDKQLTLRMTAAGDQVRFSVVDNGVGIAPENLGRIFNHGFTTRKDGHGFGLHSGANAAREMGGSVSVFTGGPGQGATFTLSLPRGRRDSPPARPRKTSLKSNDTTLLRA